MDSVPRAIQHDELLAQMGWVQALARSLVRDPNVAQDVAQQTWLTALERPPHTARSGPGLRAWLASVTRTLARQSVRGETRRTAREKRAARPEAEPAAADIVERGEMQRRLTDVVLQLDEPYRSTLLYRYLDGLSAPEIAERVGSSPVAVRKRISRGLEQLRGRLDVEYGGDRRAWSLALLPLARLPRPELLAAGAPGLGALLFTPGLLAVAALLLAVVTILFTWGGSGPETDLAGVPGGALPLPGEVPPAARPASSAAPASHLAHVEPLPVAAAPAEDAALDSWRWPVIEGKLRGRVLDVEGLPVADVRMRFEPETREGRDQRMATLTALSDRSGTFLIEGIRRRGQVLVASSRLVTVYAGNTGVMGQGSDQIIVIAPRLPLAGRVLDEQGDAVAGAEVSVVLPAGFGGRFAQALEHATRFSCATTTDVRGRFVLEQSPRIDGAQLRVSCAGFLDHGLPQPDEPTSDLVLGLRRPWHFVAGRVVDQAGTPAANARVSCGTGVVITDAFGEFRIHFRDEELDDDRVVGREVADSLHLAAVAEGRLPAQADVPVGQRPLQVEGLELTLGGESPGLSGRVVDPRGNPLGGLQVWLRDPRVFAVHLDWVRSPGGVPDGEQESFRHGRGAGLEGDPLVIVESILAGRPDEMWHYETTDLDGCFDLGAVLDQPYVIAVRDPKSLLRADSPPVQPGDEALIVLPIDETWSRVSGRVVSRDGEPLADVFVRLQEEGFRVAGNSTVNMGKGVLTGVDGSFMLADVPKRHVSLWISGQDVLGQSYGEDAPLGPTTVDVLDGLEIVVPVRKLLQVILDDPGSADRVRVLDRAGEPLPLNTFQFDRRRTRTSAEIVAGRSEILSVTDDDVTVVLLRDSEEIRRVRPILLRGEINVVR